MATNQIGIRNSNTILPYTAATKRTKTVGTVAIASGTNFTYSSATTQCYFWSDSVGNWYMSGTIKAAGDIATGTFCRLTVTGVTFKDGLTNIPVYGFVDDASYQTGAGEPNCWADANASTITVAFAESTTGENAKAVYISLADVPLNAEPTDYTTTANMEGVIAADVWIAPATATSAGLLKSYDEGTFSATFDTGAMESGSAATITLKYIRTDSTVTLFFPDTRKTATATNSTWSTSAAVLPASLIPALDMYQPFTALDNGGVPTSFSNIGIYTNGKISVNRSANWSSGTANCGFLNNCVTYLLT